MPLQIPNEEFQDILRVISQSHNGISISELLISPAIHFKKRTLQRRLNHLVEAGLLTSEGQGRGCRYLPLEHHQVTFNETSGSGYGDWRSPEAMEIGKMVRRPLAQRRPVGYQRVFLGDYQPNRTFYLPESLRENLAEMGQVGLGNLPAGTYLRQVMHRLLIDLSWNSSRLEGNTYSLLETQRLLEIGESAEGKAIQETQMILNHKVAIEMLADQAQDIGFNRYTICNLHAALSDNLLSNQAACGRLRSQIVGISGTVFHPLAVPQQIEECFDEILKKTAAIHDPFEQAFFVMVHLPYLQPFEDVNKRVSRLAANIPLIQKNLCPLSFVDVDRENYLEAIIGVYELNRIAYLRDVFFWSYQRSCARYAAVRQSLGDPDPFRLRHRSAIRRFVQEVVLKKMNKRIAAKWIAVEAKKEILQAEQDHFIEVVETELACLHEGNIVRYRLRPAEFTLWKSGWR